jgi:hypothetical protein
MKNTGKPTLSREHVELIHELDSLFGNAIKSELDQAQIRAQRGQNKHLQKCPRLDEIDGSRQD